MSEIDFDSRPASPFAWFTQWLDEAREAGGREPAAMALATADSSGRPSNRIVLFKGLDGEALAFYTNYESRKAQQLPEGAPVALCFWWDTLYRQLRIEGRVRRMATADSDRYFGSRPRASQLGAWASDQSRPAASRAELDARYAQTQARFGDADIARPPHWGGYLVDTERMEFWQGRGERMHDRREFLRDANAEWSSRRLQP